MTEDLMEDHFNENLISWDTWRTRRRMNQILIGYHNIHSTWTMRRFNNGWMITIVGSSYHPCRWEGICLHAGMNTGREQRQLRNNSDHSWDVTPPGQCKGWTQPKIYPKLVMDSWDTGVERGFVYWGHSEIPRVKVQCIHLILMSIFCVMLSFV